VEAECTKLGAVVVWTHYQSKSDLTDASLRSVNCVRSATQCRRPRSNHWRTLWCYPDLTTESARDVVLEDRLWPRGSLRTHNCVLDLGLGLGLEGSGHWP